MFVEINVFTPANGLRVAQERRLGKKVFVPGK
jgi:hypothetical protein